MSSAHKEFQDQSREEFCRLLVPTKLGRFSEPYTIIDKKKMNENIQEFHTVPRKKNQILQR